MANDPLKNIIVETKFQKFERKGRKPTEAYQKKIRRGGLSSLQPNFGNCRVLKAHHRHRTAARTGLALLVVVGVGVFGVQTVLAGRVAPNTYIRESSVSLSSAEEVEQSLSRDLEQYEARPLQIYYREGSYMFALSDLGIKLDKTATVESIPTLTWSEFPWSVKKKEVELKFELDEDELRSALKEALPDLVQNVRDPVIAWNPSLGDFEIVPEQVGWSPDLDEFIPKLKEHLAQMSTEPLSLYHTTYDPLMTATDLESEKEELIAKLSAPTTLAAEGYEWTLDWLDNLDMLTFKPVKTAQINGRSIVVSAEEESLLLSREGVTFDNNLSIEVNETALIDYVTAQIAPDVEIEPQNVTILMDPAGNITFEGTAVNGMKIQYDGLDSLVELALNKDVSRVEIPLNATPGQVDVPEELREVGITELIATGYSGYAGSPANRMHNIGVGVDRFNGVLIAPGETFSFGDRLGVVDGSTGYRQELVIKEGQTIPEYGGGICQVSSTLFRAILKAGFPIDERYAHSYAVAYYAYPDGWGLDSTVYPPAVDLKFTNDSPYPILIQSYVEGTEAYFKFYSTDDGREVVMDGPYVSNHIGAPAPVYTVTNQLSAGVIQKKDSAHNGFTAVWYRTVIYPDGRETTETIKSVYRPWAAKYLVGEGTDGYGGGTDQQE